MCEHRLITGNYSLVAAQWPQHAVPLHVGEAVTVSLDTRRVIAHKKVLH